MTKPDDSKTLITKLQSWAQATAKSADLEAIYAFGSLIYRNGVRFDPLISDIDLVITLGKKSCETPGERTATVTSLLPLKEALETTLQKALQRAGDVPIVSTVILTELDLTLAIHKDRSPTFFTDTEFFDLLTGKRSPLGSPMSQETSLSDALAAAQGAQKIRNQYLAVSANGVRKDPPTAGSDPLPKDLLRAAAQLSYASSPGLTPESKFDVNMGLLYLVETIGSLAPELREDVSKRIGGRGKESELTWETLLLYWEVLAQKAATLLKKPKGNPMDELREQHIIIKADPEKIEEGREINAPEIRRKRDIKQITSVMSTIHLPTLDELCTETPHRIYNKAFILCEHFESIINTSLFYLYDQNLNDFIQQIHSELNNILSHGEYYHATPSGRTYVFTNPGDMPLPKNKQKVWDSIDTSRKQLFLVYTSLVKYLREQYLEVDISETNQKAWKYLSNYLKALSE